MILRCISFGSLWWLRPGDDKEDSQRFAARAALFNTTGFIQRRRTRRLWMVAGVVRINAGMHSDSWGAEAFMGKAYESGGLEQRGSWNRVLLGREARCGNKPDTMLLCIHSDRIGRINFQGKWRSKDVGVVAASAHRGVQETLLLMRLGSTIQSETGIWEATWNNLKRH
jgi:hypothetical protein